MNDHPDLDALYEPPGELLQRAIKDHLTDHHLQYLRIASFFCVGTGRVAGLDVSPRGGAPGFVKAIDRKTIAFGDWPGNNRIESMRNLAADDRIALLFLFPGLDIFMRINGRGHVSTDQDLRQRLTESERVPKTAIVIRIDEVLFHCGKAISRAKLWDSASRIDRRSLPTPGTMLKALAEAPDVDPEAFDRLYDDSMAGDLY